MKTIKKLISLFALWTVIFAIGGCSLAVGEKQHDSDLTLKECYLGMMLEIIDFSSYPTSSLTSFNVDDENCVGLCFERVKEGSSYVTYLKEYGSSGKKFIQDIQYHLEDVDDEKAYTALGTIYVAESVCDFRIVQKDENGDLIIEKVSYAATSMSVGTKSDCKYSLNNKIKFVDEDNIIEKNLTVGICLTIMTKENPLERRVLQYDAAGNLLKREVVSEENGGDYILENDCEYIVIEEQTENGAERSILKPNDKFNFYFPTDFLVYYSVQFNFIKEN